MDTDRASIFPATRGTWVEQQMHAGPQGKRELAQYLLRMYAAPLRIYFLGLSDRGGFEADDVVNGFLAWALERGDYLHTWRASGKSLRRWLMNGLLLHLRTLRTNQRRAQARIADGADPADAGRDSAAAERALDLEFLRQTVREALELARPDYIQRNDAKHWELFLQHRLHGVEGVRLAQEFGLTPAQVYVKIRTAERCFERAVRTVLVNDGIDEDRIDEEILRLLRLGQRRRSNS